MPGEPNLFAYAALFLWVPVTVATFVWLRPPLAATIALVGGAMFLPEQTVIDPPLLPPMDKGTTCALWVFLCCLWKAPERIRAARPLRGIDAFFLLVLVGNLGTALTNTDPIVTGPVVRPGLGLYDAFAGAVRDTLGLYLPFLIGRAMLRTRQDLNDVMRVLVVGGLVYSVLALIEIRLSPQLHRWFYGMHAMSFDMTMRWGGYRPTIFMITGMAVAMFFLSAAVAATARWKAGRARPWAALWLTAILVAVKSTGAIVYGAVALPAVAWARRPRMWLPVSLAVLVLSFPALRGFDLFPTDTLVRWAERVDEERALSLWFRFDQEDQLLERARERILFGWGTFDRNRVFDEETGQDLSVTDGDWMIQLGSRGLVGFVGLYGMLTLSILSAARRARRIRREDDRILLSALTLVSALLTVDLLPNGLFHNLPFFFAGAISGLSASLALEPLWAYVRARRRAQSEARDATVEAELAHGIGR